MSEGCWIIVERVEVSRFVVKELLNFANEGDYRIIRKGFGRGNVGVLKFGFGLSWKRVHDSTIDPTI